MTSLFVLFFISACSLSIAEHCDELVDRMKGTSLQVKTIKIKRGDQVYRGPSSENDVNQVCTSSH